MSLTPAAALISLQDGVLAPVNLNAGDVGLYTPGNDLVFRLQSTKYIQRAEFTLIAPRYPGLHQLTYSWVPGQYNGWQITFPASALVTDASILAGLAIVATVTDSSGSITGTNFLESKGSGGSSTTAGIFAAVTASNVTAGDEVTGAAFLADPGRITKAVPAAMLLNDNVWGVALFTALAGALTLYAGVGATIPGSLVGITGDGNKAYAILNITTGGTLRKTSPEAADYVLGEIDTVGNIHIFPWRPQTGMIVIGSPGYECIGDGDPSHDCKAAIQRAFDNALVGTQNLPASIRKVYFPRGKYFCSGPVHAKWPGSVVEGEGDYSSVVHCPQFAGPGLLVSNLLVPYPTVSDSPFPGQPFALHTETHADVLDDRFLDLSEYGNGCNVNGFTGFTIRTRIRVSSTGTGDGVVIASSGHRFLSDPGGTTGGACGYALFVNPIGNGITWRVNCTGNPPVGVNAALGPSGGFAGIPLDQWFWIEAFFGVGASGGQMGVFVENLATGLMTKLQFLAATGTMQQQDWETTQIGTGFSDIFGEGSSYNVMKGDIAHLQFDSARLHDFGANANYTDVATFPSYGNNRPGASGTTCFYMDMQSYDGVFVGGRTAFISGNNAMGNFWTPVVSRGPTEGPVGSHISELNIYSPYGPALVMFSGIKCTIKRILGQGKTGLLFRNNCYTSRVEDCSFIASNDSHYGIMLGGAAYETSVTDCQLTGFKYGCIAQSAAVINGGYFIDNTQYGILMFDASNFSVVGTSVSDEGGGYVNPLNGIGLIRSACVNLTGCVFLNVTGSGNCIVSENSGFFSQRSDINLNGTSLNSHGPIADQVPHIPGLPAVANYHFRIVNTDGFVTSVNSDTYQFSLVNPSIVPGVALPIIDPLSSTNVEWNLRPTSVFGHWALAMADANQTVTADQWLRGNLDCTGAMTANRTVTVPVGRTPPKLVTNKTTGGFSILIKTLGGAVTYTIPNTTPPTTWSLSSDGTELRHIQ